MSQSEPQCDLWLSRFREHLRSLFGHVSLDTTNQYARANIETKRRALERVDPSKRPSAPPRWKRNPELLAWLDSL